MRLRSLLLVLIALACAHAGQKPSTEGQATGSGTPPTLETTPSVPGQPPLAASPSGLLAPEGARKIQDALRDKGFQTAHDGILGPETKGQLQAFQKSRHLPETGMPDTETLRKLGLNPDDLYKTNPK